MQHLSTTVQSRQTILNLAVAPVAVPLLPPLALSLGEREALDIIANSPRPVFDVFSTAIADRLSTAGYVTRSTSTWGNYITVTPFGRQFARTYPRRKTRHTGTRRKYMPYYVYEQRAQFEHFIG